jgi:beta-phosphoglucomutase
MIRAILFDFNGVIINDEPLQMKAYTEIFNEEGIPMTEADYYSCMGMDDKTFINHNFNRVGKELSDEKSAEISARKTVAWRKMVEKEIPVFDGVKNFIKIVEKHFALAIVSMAKREEIEFALEKIGVKDSFSAIISSENVSVCKPNPECYNAGFRLLDDAYTANGHHPLTRKECLVIEDATQGIMAGKAARMKTLGVSNTVSADELRAAGANAVTKTLADWMPSSIQRVF